MKISIPPMVMRLVQSAILIALVVLLWRTFDARAAVDHLRSAEPVWLVAAGLALTIQTVLSAQRWRVTAAQLGLDIPVFSALREYYLAQVVNQSLPGGVVGDAGRAVRSRGKAGLLVASQAVVFERIAGQLGLIAILLTGLSLAAIAPNAMDWPLWLLRSLAFAGLGMGFAAGLCVLSPSVRRATRPFFHAVWANDVRLQQIALNLGTAICNVMAFAFCALALGISMPTVAIASIVPLILFAMVLPLSIGGWGLREGAAAVLFPVIGATSAEGLATSIAFGLVLLATILPAIIFPLIRSNASASARDASYMTQKPKEPSAERTTR